MKALFCCVIIAVSTCQALLLPTRHEGRSMWPPVWPLRLLSSREGFVAWCLRLFLKIPAGNIREWRRACTTSYCVCRAKLARTAVTRTCDAIYPPVAPLVRSGFLETSFDDQSVSTNPPVCDLRFFLTQNLPTRMYERPLCCGATKK